MSDVLDVPARNVADRRQADSRGVSAGVGVTFGRHVVRVGALAVALGVGAALTGSHGAGVARADTGTDSSQAPSSGGAPGGAAAPGPNDAGAESKSERSTSTSAETDSERSESKDTRSATSPITSGGAETIGEDAGQAADPDADAANGDAPPTESTVSATDTDSTTHTEVAPVAVPDAPPARANRIATDDSSPQPVAARPNRSPDADADDIGTTTVNDGAPAQTPAASVAVPTTQASPTVSAVAVVPPTVLAPSESRAVQQVSDLIATPVAFVFAVMAAVLAPFTAATPGAPADGVSFLELFFAARREVRGFFVNNAPTATSGQIAHGQGTVSGTLGAADVDGDPLTFAVTLAPTNGSVEVHVDGTFTYTPRPEFAVTGVSDTFTVSIDDGRRSLFLSGATGLGLSLFGGTGQISETVTVLVVPANEATVAVGDAPQGVALSPDGSRAYVTNSVGDTVSVVDTATDAVVATVSGVTGYPVGVAVSPDGTRAYTANFYGNSVSVIDTATNAVIATVPVGGVQTGGTAQHVVVSPDGARVYVSNFSGDSVSVIDTTTNTVIAVVAVADEPDGLAISPDGTRLYVTSRDDDSVIAIDTVTGAVVGTVAVGASPTSPAVSPDGTRLYVVNYLDNSVSVIDTATTTVVATLENLGSRPGAVTVSADGLRAYVALEGVREVAVIDTATNTVVSSIVVSGTPSALAVNAAGTQLYVTDFEGDALATIALVSAPTVRPPLSAATGPSTRGFDVYNLTAQPVTFIGYDTRSSGTLPTGGPKVGTVLNPGDRTHFEVIYRFLADNNVVAQFQTASGAVYSVNLQVSGAGVRRGSCSSSSPGACTTSNITPGSSLAEVELLDAPNTVVDLTGANGQTVANVLNGLCAKGARASCDFDATSEIMTFTADRQVGSGVINQTANNQTTTINVSDTVTNTNSLTVGAKLSLDLGDVVDLELSAEYGHTWEKSFTFTQSLNNVVVPPNTQVFVFATQPVLRDFGNFTVVVGNTTVIVNDVSFDTPNENGGGAYRIVQSPISS